MTGNFQDGWLEQITEVNFGQRLFAEVYGSVQNNMTVKTDVPTPSASASALGGAKLIWKQLSPVNSLLILHDYWVWQPLVLADSNFFAGSPCGPLQWSANVVPIGYNTLDDAIHQTNLPSGSQGSIGGGPWKGVGPAYPDTPTRNGNFSLWAGPNGAFSTLAQAQAFSTFISAGWSFVPAGVCMNTGDPRMSSPAQSRWNTMATAGPPTYIGYRSLSYDYFFKVKNDSKNPQVTITLDGIATANVSAGINVKLWTTRDPAGTKNFTYAQATKFKTPPDISALGANPDAHTGLNIPLLVNGTYKFTFWRVSAKPLRVGAHIKATSPIPSV